MQAQMTATSPAVKPKRVRRRREQVCYCSAYNFPHRTGSGKCEGPGRWLCKSCGKVCRPELHDNGIGAYEYWGAKEVDTQLDWESDCCHAQVLENNWSKDPASTSDLVADILEDC